MSQVSPKSNPTPFLPSSYPSETLRSNDMDRRDSGEQDVSDSLHGRRPSLQVLDNLPDFSYDLTEKPRDPLDSWPGQVEMRPRRRSTILSSLIRGNQPHRSFFGDNLGDDESEPTATEKNQAPNPLDNARRLCRFRPCPGGRNAHRASRRIVVLVRITHPPLIFFDTIASCPI
jgi:hypothetical protein